MSPTVLARIEARPAPPRVTPEGEAAAAAAAAWSRAWRELRRRGLVLRERPTSPPDDAARAFAPVRVSGEPLSRTIVRERR